MKSISLDLSVASAMNTRGSQNKNQRLKEEKEDCDKKKKRKINNNQRKGITEKKKE